MSKGSVPTSKIPTIGGDTQDHQSAQMIVQYLRPILEQLGEQMAAFDVIQDDIMKRLDKLEARNNVKITFDLASDLKTRIDRSGLLGWETAKEAKGAEDEHEMSDKKTSKA